MSDCNDSLGMDLDPETLTTIERMVAAGEDVDQLVEIGRILPSEILAMLQEGEKSEAEVDALLALLSAAQRRLARLEEGPMG